MSKRKRYVGQTFKYVYPEKNTASTTIYGSKDEAAKLKAGEIYEVFDYQDNNSRYGEIVCLRSITISVHEANYIWVSMASCVNAFDPILPDWF